MRDVAIFLSGGIFSLIVVYVSFRVSFMVVEFKEDREVKSEIKKKNLLKAAATGGSIIRPKTPQQIANEKDEELQAIKDVLNN